MFKYILYIRIYNIKITAVSIQLETTMKKLIISLFIAWTLMICINALQAQTWEWSKRIGGSQVDEIERVETDPSGNVLVVGKFSGSFMYENYPMNSAGSKNIFVSKYAADGTLLWVRGLGGVGLDEGLCVGTDKDDNVLISGSFTGQAVFDTVVVNGFAGDEIFIVKYNALGEFQWVRTAGGPGNEKGKGIAADQHGNVWLTGYYYDTCHFGNQTLVSPGLDNIFVAKYDPVGNLKWVADAGGVYSAWASSISIDGFDRAYITGSFKQTAVFGAHSITSYGGNDVFLARIDSSGTWTLAVHAGGTADDFGNGIEVDVNNHIAVTGSFFQTVLFPPTATISSNGDKDGFVAFYDPSGSCLWARNMGGSGSDKGIEVSNDKDGNVYVTGYINGNGYFDTLYLAGNGNDEIFLARYYPGGALQYAVLAGGSSQDYGKGVQCARQGVAYVAGFFQGTATFGSQVLTSAGDRDAYVARYYDGSPLFLQQPASQDVCAGDSLHLSVQMSGPGPFSYLWFDEAGSILGAVYPFFSLKTPDTTYSGKYYCMVSNAHGSVTSDTAMVRVHPLPAVDLVAPDTLMYQDTLVLFAGGGFASYLWSNGATADHIVLYPVTLGTGMKTFSVTVTDQYGCQAADTVRIMIVHTGMEEYWPSDIRVYPNPATGHLVIDRLPQGILDIRCFDLYGRRVYPGARFDPLNLTLNIDAEHLPAGTYIVSLRTEKGVIPVRFVVYRH